MNKSDKEIMDRLYSLLINKTRKSYSYILFSDKVIKITKKDFKKLQNENKKLLVK